MRVIRRQVRSIETDVYLECECHKEDSKEGREVERGLTIRLGGKEVREQKL